MYYLSPPKNNNIIHQIGNTLVVPVGSLGIKRYDSEPFLQMSALSVEPTQSCCVYKKSLLRDIKKMNIVCNN